VTGGATDHRRLLGVSRCETPSGVSAITNVNAKYLFFGLIIVWIGTRGLRDSLELPTNSVGAPALIGLFAGIFIFMGFIWAVIGE